MVKVCQQICNVIYSDVSFCPPYRSIVLFGFIAVHRLTSHSYIASSFRESKGNAVREQPFDIGGGLEFWIRPDFLFSHSARPDYFFTCLSGQDFSFFICNDGYEHTCRARIFFS